MRHRHSLMWKHGSIIPVFLNKKHLWRTTTPSMKPKQIIKIITDISMTVVQLFLMAYSLVGEAIHEWLGIGMFALFILHHILNGKWSRSLLKGKYTPFRILQTVLVALALCSMLGSMISGIILSRHALDFLPITGGQSWARTLHMLSSKEKSAAICF